MSDQTDCGAICHAEIAITQKEVDSVEDEPLGIMTRDRIKRMNALIDEMMSTKSRLNEPDQ